MGRRKGEKKYDELKANPNIKDLFILKVHNKYRVHLLREFREKFNIESEDLILITRETKIDCPHCKKQLNFPGLRMFIVKKEDFNVVLKEENNVVQPVRPSSPVVTVQC